MTVHEQGSDLGGGAAGAGRPLRRRGRRRRFIGYLFVLPAFAVYAIFAIAPAFQTGYWSLYSWNGISPSTWVGLKNYAEVFTDPLLRQSLANALILVIFFCALPLVIGLLIAGIVAQVRSRWMRAARTLLFLPQIFPLVVVGIVWRWMYDVDGPVNQMLRVFGLGHMAHPWLAQHESALVAVGFIGAWVMTGFCMLLFASGAQKIDRALFEAARIDGAGPIREFFAVTLPELRGEIRVALTVTLVAALASFDIVFVTTNGGPANSTLVPSLVLYRLAFTDHEIGVAAAVGTSLSVLILGLVLLINRLTREK